MTPTLPLAEMFILPWPFFAAFVISMVVLVVIAFRKPPGPGDRS